MKITCISESVEYNEPNGYFQYDGGKYPFWGSPTGRLKTDVYDISKFNRYAKLGSMVNNLIVQLEKEVDDEYESVDGRCAFASILMMKYGIRVGNEDSASGYESGLEDNEGEVVYTYGTTTLENKHVTITDDNIKLDFLGKTQVEHHIEVDDPFILKYAAVYHGNNPDEKWIGIEYNDLFRFIKKKVGINFVPKDLRTFCANVTAWNEIKKYLNKSLAETKTEANDEIAEIVERTSNRLGNTPSIAKRNYIDSRMLDWFKTKRLGEE